MATIKLQDGKVILKGGRVSCECCEPPPPPISCGEVSGANVFLITESAYRSFYNGGTWNVSTVWSQYEAADPNCLANGTGSGNVSEYQSGCIHEVNGIANATTTYTGNCGDSTQNYTFNFGIKMQLGVDSMFPNGGYYVKYSAYSNVSTTEATSGTGYPTKVNFYINNSYLLSYGTWTPAWSTYNGYQNNSEIILYATFN